jgi:hypothetical protein
MAGSSFFEPIVPKPGACSAADAAPREGAAETKGGLPND